MDSPQPNWERSVLEKLAMEAVREQRKARQWSIFFRLMTFAVIFLLLFGWFGWLAPSETVSGKHTAMVEVRGVIDDTGPASAENVNSALRAAFKDKNTKGVVLRINSPGGSPVQAGMVNDEIRRLKTKYPNTPIYAVVEDVCASGGYYIAAAADRIYVDKASMVGSIGVLMDGFGFTGTMEKLGIERRLLTAGENKGFLDPFQPLSAKQRAYAQSMLEEIHGQFIDVVRKGRGKRLKETPDLFSGLVWNGAKSVELGLADGFGSIDSVARDLFQAEEVVDFTVEDNFAERFAKRFGASVGEAIGRAAVKSTVDAGTRQLR